MIQRKGIALHGLKATKRALEGWEIISLKSYWGQQYIHLEGFSYSKVYICGKRYEAKDNVVITLGRNTNLGHQNKARGVCKITGFLSHEHNGGIELFLIGEFINGGNGIDALQLDKVIGMRVISDVDFSRKKKCLLPTYAILHKCFFLPLSNTQNKVIYEMSDTIFRTWLLQPGKVGCARPWVEIGDVVLVVSSSSMSTPSFKVAVVFNINIEQKAVELGFLRRDPTMEYWNVQGEKKWCHKI
ncbi:hypothetical protein GOP47_0015796 [Adiantum capillus-veneris]|uniref:Uncharacterized protein n=1 Tax=Adiantum capillus-veneris TaxID=13818 RepID=A0A9D4UKD6_ADICA|nr:hypothetical protein GOP47_0015796 [Adiantum capillus-veneris]